MGISSRVELLDSPFANFRGHRSTWLLLVSACCFAEFDNNLFKICHVLTLSIARYVLKYPSNGFQGKKFDMFCEHQ